MSQLNKLRRIKSSAFALIEGIYVIKYNKSDSNMKYLKSLFLVIFLLLNLNCFAKEVHDIQNNEVSNIDIKDKNKENTKDEREVPDYISNPKEHAEKFYRDTDNAFLTVLSLLAFVVLCLANKDSSEDGKGRVGSSKPRESMNFVGSRSDRWLYRRR